MGIYWVYPPLKGGCLGLKQLGYHPKGTTIFSKGEDVQSALPLLEIALAEDVKVLEK